MGSNISVYLCSSCWSSTEEVRLKSKVKPTAAQKKFWDEIVEIGCVLDPDHEVAEIDHLVGSSVKVNGENIGNWWVIALSPSKHRLGPMNRTHHEQEFYESYICSELYTSFSEHKKALFMAQLVRWKMYYKKPLPMPLNIIEAILEY